MLHHVEIYVSNLSRSTKFWEPFTEHLGYKSERWSGGMNYSAGNTYLCFLEASPDYLAAGYHRKRIGLNHLAFHGKSRAHVDEITAWVKQAGYGVLYEDQHPHASGPDYYALYCEDPDRIKVEVVAPD